MSTRGLDATRIWRLFFLGLETVVVVLVLFCLLGEWVYGVSIEPKSQVQAIVFGVSFALAWLFLLIASPFFLRSLRGVALAGWIIAFGILLLGLLSAIRECQQIRDIRKRADAQAHLGQPH